MKAMAILQSISPALKRRTADGAEAPYSGASGTMRQRAESRQPTFWDCSRCHPVVFFGVSWNPDKSRMMLVLSRIVKDLSLSIQ
jgi:hypothetical protein